MKVSIVKHKNINNGEETRIYCPLAKKEFETQLVEIFERNHYEQAKIKKDAIILDVGANIGMTTLYLKDWAKHIYAIEPSKENFRALKGNVNGLKNVSCHNYAIFPSNTTERFYKNDPTSTPQTFFPDGGRQSNFYYEEVDCITLETFMQQEKIKHIDVMKIDAEGSEYIIFPGKSFSRVADKIDFIIGESHFGEHGFPDILPVVLKDHGFETEFIKHDPPNYVRNFIFTDMETKEEKKYSVQYNTMFVARRKDAKANKKA